MGTNTGGRKKRALEGGGRGRRAHLRRFPRGPLNSNSRGNFDEPWQPPRARGAGKLGGSLLGEGSGTEHPKCLGALWWRGRE